ncbi:hypothetical protein OUZ56_032761 [Daphnia magna]|uniref:DDE Tnp4 domain-containing protein n=1 Tax=Daphnia magna TaxID=35525 RepID=A0ABQ9ZX10_9CRUS|nr:hypothetical protein OUZ56_032761 [Daphnia magna]
MGSLILENILHSAFCFHFIRQMLEKLDLLDKRHRRKSRLVPFYQTRKDVLTYFEDDRIFRTFHSDRESIQYITGLVTPLLPKSKTKAKRNLEPLDMVLISLQYYATGTFQAAMGNILRYSQSSVSCSIAAVSLSLSLLSKQFIKFPQDLNQVLLSQSLKVVICGQDYKFYSVCATKPGSCHHSSILKTSTIGKKFSAGECGHGVLLGDSGVMVACSVLHNIAIDRNQPLDNDWGEDDDEEDNEDPLPIDGAGRSAAVERRLGKEKRDRVARETFGSENF